MTYTAEIRQPLVVKVTFLLNYDLTVDTVKVLAVPVFIAILIAVNGFCRAGGKTPGRNKH